MILYVAIIMKNNAFWSNPGYVPRKPLSSFISCDYLIVGGGVTGISLSYFLRKYTKNIVLIEKNIIASGATGRAAGVIVPDPDLDIRDLTKRFGKKALKIWDFYENGFNTMKKIARKIDCDMEFEKAFMGHFYNEKNDFVIEEYKDEKKDRKKVRLLDKKDLLEEVSTTAFKDAVMRSERMMSINPLKYSQNLSKMLSDKGVAIYEHTPFLSYRNNIAITPRGRIQYKKIIFAIDSFSDDASIHGYKGTIAVTKRLSKKQLQSLMDQKYIFWDDLKFFDYLKITKDNRILVGSGERKIRNQSERDITEREHVKHLRHFLKKIFPQISWHFEYAWSGTYGISSDGLPIIKKRGNAWYVLAPTGQNVSTSLGDYVAQKLVKGKKMVLDDVFMK